MNGGTYDKRKQRAVIEFQCDKDRTGNEGNEKANSLRQRDDNNDNKEVENENSLTFVSYGSVEGKELMDILRLNWKTKYACEDAPDDDNIEKKAGWGFFTWFILMYVLASYPDYRYLLTC
jgi:autophagy-related protein 27